jgi:hypothetical protein
MRIVRPLSETADDLSQVVVMILNQEPWDVILIQKALHCYRSWFDYAVHIEQVKIEILFPYFLKDAHHRTLTEVFDSNVGLFFTNLGTIWTAADVFNDIAESSSLTKASSQILMQVLSGDTVQKSWEMYANGSIGLDSFAALASLAITLVETLSAKLIDPPTSQNVRMLEIMLFLLASDQSSRTFNFWISFAEASVDIDDGHRADLWLKQALAILLDKSLWSDNMDEEEWLGYRTDVSEVFEGICEVLGPEIISSVVLASLETAASDKTLGKAVCHEFLCSCRLSRRHCSFWCLSKQSILSTTQCRRIYSRGYFKWLMIPGTKNPFSSRKQS